MPILENHSLRAYNTFGIDISAKYFATFNTVEELKMLLQTPEAKSNNLLVLGGGSNILATNDVQGFVLKNELKGIHVAHETDTHVYVECKAGEIWHEFVEWCILCNYQGVENLSWIPGTVGASPMQNIGAYGVEIKDVFDSLEALEIESLQIKRFDKDACAFGYRESVFKNVLKGKYIITSVLFKLNKTPIINTSYGVITDVLAQNNITFPTIRDVSDAVISIRKSKLPDPKEIGNAGSFFKNPSIDTQQYHLLKAQFLEMPGYKVSDALVKVPAGWLIEQCGWKGYTNDNYGVHKHQALVLVNYGGASGKDIVKLSETIIKSVQDKFGIQLCPEVNII